MTGIAEIASRVQDLHNLCMRPAPPATTGAGFASALAQAQAGQPGTGGGAGPTGADAVAAARRYLGVPYVWGGTDPATGLDCSGLVQRVYADLGVRLPRVSGDQARAGTAVASLADARPGDVLAFGHPVDHVAIYLGGNQMIAAPEPGDHVRVQQVYAPPTAIRRLLPDPAGPLWTTPVGRPANLGGVVGPSGLAGPGGLAAVPYGELFSRAGSRYGVPPALLAAVAKVESGYDPNAVSPAGARGLMQLMPRTAAGLGVDPMDPARAVDGAARLLAGHLADFGSVPLALAAYNAGPGAVRRYGGVPPYPETQSYVQKVQAALAALTGVGA
ncbi:MAG TPA: transglycosylase SLT domain-containing protein [Mycobacteriales bacterium]|nr:transglycosylase SLT domain-containing protein [Mycobacteriales bacterium]